MNWAKQRHHFYWRFFKKPSDENPIAKELIESLSDVSNRHMTMILIDGSNTIWSVFKEC